MKKLSFKGDSVTKSVKKRKVSTKTEIPQGWILIESKEDISGPIVLVVDNQLMMATESNIDLLMIESLQDLEPSQVAQVFMATSLPDSTKITFKSSFDKYLTCDKLGVVSCDRDAAGPTEEWTVVMTPDGISLQNVFGKFLALHDSCLRGDEPGIGPYSTFQIKCQAQLKYQLKKSKKTTVIEVDVEMEKLRASQAFGYRHISSLSDMDSLYSAKKSGHLHQELLDRRSKLKGDKFCK